ncbi:hypothetical protein PybrP1_004173 [[Pythium] brassicae (nom. inval.)]|nr:hypothetical protein PybrP1_004173 [[Pythium] brassicae (nom. inval.)]
MRVIAVEDHVPRCAAHRCAQALHASTASARSSKTRHEQYPKFEPCSRSLLMIFTPMSNNCERLFLSVNADGSKSEQEGVECYSPPPVAGYHQYECIYQSSAPTHTSVFSQPSGI